MGLVSIVFFALRNHNIKYTVVPISENSCFIYVVQFSICLQWVGHHEPVNPFWLEMEVHSAFLKQAGKHTKGQLLYLALFRGVIQKRQINGSLLLLTLKYAT